MSFILVVDDADHVRKHISHVLKAEGYDMLEASDGEEAMNVIRHNSVDLLIIDILMPKKNGMETLLEFRNELARIKKIIITGELAQTRESFISLTKYLDVHHVLYKPFRKQELIDSVNRLLRENE